MWRHFTLMEKSGCLKARLSKVFTERQAVGFPKLLHPEKLLGVSSQQIWGKTGRES